MATKKSHLVTYAKHEENGETTNLVFEEMVNAISFGHNEVHLTDANFLMLGCDRGCVFRDFVSKMIDCRVKAQSTLKRCPWDPIT